MFRALGMGHTSVPEPAAGWAEAVRNSRFAGRREVLAALARLSQGRLHFLRIKQPYLGMSISAW
jgi:hypothetical protein